MSARRILLLFAFCFAFLFSVRATHNRAGEITYKRIEPFSRLVGGIMVQVYNYSITLIKYTDHGNLIADRCVDTIYFGDGQRGIAPRINGSPGLSCNNCFYQGQQLPCGEIIINENFGNYVVKKNIYTIEHEYSGPGNYLIRTLDPNRNKGVYNIPLSDERPFYLESLLIINSFTGANSSPVLGYPPIDRACVGKCFEHSPGAYDPDGTDSLSYEITTSRGEDGSTVTGYSFPETGTGGSYGIDPVKGILRWCVPQLQAEYNLAFIVKEWRKNTSGVFQLNGYVLRDMQVIVLDCAVNKPPVLIVPPDMCVEAGTRITETIFVSDPNNGNIVTVDGEGGAFEAVPPKATFGPSVITTYTSVGTYSSTFNWQTTCAHVRQLGYETYFKASDSYSIKAVTFKSFNIRVVPPSVKDVTATPSGSNMRVSWTLSSCNSEANPLVAYKVYRKDDCTPFVYKPCQTGPPDSSGFVYLGMSNASTSFFIDDNKGMGLVVGQNYSYIVIAVYQDGTATFAGAQVCAKLKRDVPVLLNVDVRSTSVTDGTIRVRWAMPLISGGNLDTTAFPGPYRFNVMHRAGNAGGYTQVHSVSLQYYKPFNTQGMDTYDHAAINTAGDKHEYYVEFIAGDKTIGSSQKATSVFLSTTPSDRKIDLSWESATPWNNKSYEVWRKDPGKTTFVFMGTTSLTTFSDTLFIANKNSYCYYVRSEGSYSDPSILSPLINNSQESCATAVDKTPPCPPTPSIEAICPEGLVKIIWNDIRKARFGDDVVEYKLFSKSTFDGNYVELFLENTKGLSYDMPKNDGLLIAGCYAVMSIDSSGNKSALSADFCIDNCPEFELPNIFSPNEDGINDEFKAIKVRQINEIDLRIVDRWGNQVYKTRDPYFKWDGKSSITKLPVSDGTLFIVCDVFEPRLKGLVKRNLHGFVELVR